MTRSINTTTKQNWFGLFTLGLLLLQYKTTLASNHVLLLWEDEYSFEQFIKDYGKVYYDKSEYNLRSQIFHQNLLRIIKHNRQRSDTDHSLGPNDLMDRNPDELPLGYIKTPRIGRTSAQRHLAQHHKMDLPFEMDDVSVLPPSMSWHGVSTPIKSQGGCGSCWAFASTAVLESHIAIQTGVLFSLSMQELVSCAPNPMDCGGNGGCTGATASVAYDYVATAGIVQEWQFGYRSYDGSTVACTLDNSTLPQLRGPDPPGIKGAVAMIDGYAETPANNFKAMMNAVAKTGPVAVSVAASNWHLYQGGVFEDHSMNPQATDINHLVVLEGYGTDQETGQDYWLIRNSWGPRWGESGYIRLLRVDPSTLPHPDNDCGVDVTPNEGDACSKDENGKSIIPPAEKVCGTSGVYYSGTIPIGGRLV